MDKVPQSELDSYLAHFSKDSSEDIKKYANDVILLRSRYIFTSREKGKQIGYCTHCNSSFPTDELIRKIPKSLGRFVKKEPEKMECPNCRSECIVKASGRGRKTMMDEGYFVYYEKSVIDPDAMVAMGIYVVRDYTGSYENVETQYKEIAIYHFKMGESSMLRRYCWYGKSYHTGEVGMHCGEYEKCKKIYSLANKDHFANISTGYSHESVWPALRNTPFKYSTWESYARGDDMVKFFDLYSKYPCVEYLTKFGLQYLVREKLDGHVTYSSINWRGKTLLKVLRLSKQDLNEIKNNNIYISFFLLRIIQLSKKNKWNLTMEEIKLIDRKYGNNFVRLQSMLKYGSMKKILSYISKQCKNTNDYYGEASTLGTWKDYLEDCKKLEMDITNEQILFPRDLHMMHQNTIKQIRLKADETLNFKIKARLGKLKKYRFESNGLLIRPVTSTNELIAEGSALSHCVGGYASRYAKGETNILVIRKVSEPDKPYYTMEVRNDEIIQTRGKNNRSPEEDVKEFIKVFTEEKLTKKKIKTPIQITVAV